jgi:hypothetical protein
MPNEKSIISKMLGIFRAKGTELTSDEVAGLTDTILDSFTTEKVMPDTNVNHNAALVSQLKDMITNIKLESETNMKQMKESFEAQVSSLTEIAAKYKEDAEKRQSILDEQLTNEKQTKISTLIQDAISKGKIEPENKERQDRYKTLLETNFDLVSKEIDSLPIISNVQSMPQQSGSVVNKFVAPVRGFGSGINASLLKETQELIEATKN